jgi:preprotein translocase subunit SecD
VSKRRSRLVEVCVVMLFTLGLLGWSFWSGNKPFLGLDLQGGVAVILTPSGEATDEQLEDAVTIIRSRVDAIGVAEPEITRQGQNISVEIPGVEDPQQAIELVGQTGELTFRPVLQEYQTGFEVDADGNPVVPELTPEAEVSPEGQPTDSTVAPGTDTTVPPSTDTSVEGSFPLWSGAAEGELAAGTQDPLTDQTPTSVVDLGTVGGPDAPLGDASGGLPELTGDTGLDQVVVEAQYRTVDGKRFEVGRYRLGPASLTGAGLESASASLDDRGQWVVRPVFKSGPEGIDAFNQTAGACFAKNATCPTGLFAITLDAEVISALGVQAASFSRDQIVISGGFDEQSAKDLATVLRYGALPVKLEIQSVQEVSATLGRDALRAGLIAGGIGLGLVALYMFAFYRLLGITAIIKLGIELALLWVIIAWLGTSQGLALTLAGVTGIIVSFGLSVDSNVVYFETVKEDIRNGRSVRSAADRAFRSSWTTIVKADFASLIAAVLLYVLAIGPVRGFAFYLGLATLLDLLACWIFMRPSAALLLRSGLCERHPGWFGLTGPARRSSRVRRGGGDDAPGTGGGLDAAGDEGDGEPAPIAARGASTRTDEGSEA